MSDLRDFTGKNRKFTGTIGERISIGTTVDRDESFGQGTLRFNTTTTLMEYYDGTQWKPIDAPPTIASVSPATFKSDGSTLHTITVTGSNFGIGCTAKFIGEDGTQYTPGTTTRISSSSVTMTTLTTMTVANEPYDVQIINASGLSAILENALDAGSSPAFTASAGSLGTLLDGNRAATALTSQTFGPATDADAQQINYSVTSGNLPAGLRLGTANDGNNGKILGTATEVGTNTTSSFTITASDGVNTASRAYSITVNAPTVTSYTTGSGTFTVPSGVTSVRVLVVAGGGGGGGNNSGGGGAGGYVEMPSFPVTPGGSVSYSIGTGGARGPGGSNSGSAGTDSTFGTLTAKGGAGSDYWTTFRTADSGGSGAGGSGNPGYRAAGGSGTQPGQPGNSGTYGFGNPGGQGGNATGDAGGGGGGGAGGAGVDNQAFPGSATYPGSGSAGGHGGLAKLSNISGSNVYYSGGGGGGSGGGGTGPYWPGEAIGGVGGIGGPFSQPYGATPLGGGGPGGSAARGTTGSNGGTNTGGGAGGGDNTDGGIGGPGIIIVRY